MNVDLPSIVSNRMYAFGEAFATAEAWVLTNLSTDPSDDQTTLDAMEADITTVGGLALSARNPATYPWYRGYTLFADLPASSAYVQPVPGFDLTGQDGKVVSVADGAFVLGSGGGGGSLTGVGAFDTTPNADGLSVTAGDVSLSAADATHPGGVSAAAQTFGGPKKFDSGLLATGGTADITTGSALGVMAGTDATFHIPMLWLAQTTLDLAHCCLWMAGGNVTNLNSPSTKITFQIGGTKAAELSGTQLDLTGLGNGGSIVLKSPDGTVYTLSIANGGTVHIV